MYKILIVEDDRTIAGLLCDHLRKWNFDAQYVVDFSRVIEEFLSFKPDIVLLDISLPFFNGYYWCAEIRKQSKVPIVFLSSRTENMDIIMAMNMGGDDYITKPFSMDIVIAKINALLRRTYSYFAATQTLEAGGVLLNIGERTASYKEHTLELTNNEAKILIMLFERKNNVVSREEIMKRLWDSDSFIDDNTLTVNVNRLRKRLSDIGVENLIETRKGEGYAIRDR